MMNIILFMRALVLINAFLLNNKENYANIRV